MTPELGPHPAAGRGRAGRVRWLAALGVRLPAYVTIRGEHGAIYIPIATMIVVSVVLTILLNLFWRR